MTAIGEHREKDSTPSASLDQEDGVESQQCFAGSKAYQRRFSSEHRSLVVSFEDRSTKPQNLYSCILPLKKSINGSAYRCVSTMKGHEGCIYSIAFAKQYNLLYSGSIDKGLRVCGQYDHSRELVEHCRFGCEGGAVKFILVARDKIFSAHRDHRIRIWKHSKSPRDSALHHNLMCTIPTVKDYLLNFLLPKNYVQIRRHKQCLWIQHADTVSAMAVKNGNLYSASWDRTVKVWRLSDFRCLDSFRAHDDAINAMIISSAGFVYTASGDSTIKVWTKYAHHKKHSLVTVMDRHKFAVNALALSPDGLILYSGGGDSSIFVWQVDKMVDRVNVSVASELKGHRLAVLCLATVSDIVCYGSADKSIRVWRREAGTLHSCLAVLEGHTAPVKCITAHIDDFMQCLTMHTGSLDGEIRVWHVLHNAVKE